MHFLLQFVAIRLWLFKKEPGPMIGPGRSCTREARQRFGVTGLR